MYNELHVPGSRVAVEAEDGVWRLGRVLAMRPGQVFSVRLDSGGQVITPTSTQCGLSREIGAGSNFDEIRQRQ